MNANQLNRIAIKCEMIKRNKQVKGILDKVYEGIQQRLNLNNSDDKMLIRTFDICRRRLEEDMKKFTKEGKLLEYYVECSKHRDTSLRLYKEDKSRMLTKALLKVSLMAVKLIDEFNAITNGVDTNATIDVETYTDKIARLPKVVNCIITLN